MQYELAHILKNRFALYIIDEKCCKWTALQTLSTSMLKYFSGKVASFSFSHSLHVCNILSSPYIQLNKYILLYMLALNNLPFRCRTLRCSAPLRSCKRTQRTVCVVCRMKNDWKYSVHLRTAQRRRHFDTWQTRAHRHQKKVVVFTTIIAHIKLFVWKLIIKSYCCCEINYIIIAFLHILWLVSGQLVGRAFQSYDRSIDRSTCANIRM